MAEQQASMRPSRAVRLVAAVAAGVLLLATGSLGDLPDAAAAVRAVRLEAGPQRGFRFSASGAVLARKNVELAAPADVSSNRRRTVPNRAGWYIRITSGVLAGWEVRESAVAYRTGKAGDTEFDPPAKITFLKGRYLGYRFDASWRLVSTRFRSLTADGSARASRRAVINGRPYVLITTGAWTGRWIPVTSSTSRTAQRLTCSVGAKPAAGAIETYRRVATTDRAVALTFDLGGRLTPAVDIVEQLVVDRVCATIFPTGEAAQTATGRAVMALVRAHPELFEVGNHTQHHCNLRDGGPAAPCPATAPSASFIWTELNTAEDVIEALTGRTPRPYWRPPYGAVNAWIKTVAAEIGYTKTILWDVDTIDWRRVRDGGPTAAAIAATVVTKAQRGSIVLMHLGGWNTLDALPSMVQRLRASDLEPTTLTELLR